MKNKTGQNFRVKMLHSFIIITLIPFAIMIGASIYLTREALETEIFAVLSEESTSDANALSKILISKIELLKNTAAAPSIRGLSSNKVFENPEISQNAIEYFERLINEEIFDFVVLSDSQGISVLDRSNSTFQSENKDWIDEFNSDLTRFGQDVIVESLTDNKGIMISVPTGGGALTAIIPLRDFQYVITDMFIVDDNTDMYILDQNNNLLFTERENSLTKYNELFAQSQTNDLPYGNWFSGSNQEFLFATSTTQFEDTNFQWKVFHIEAADQAFQPILKLIRIELIIAGSFIVAMFILIYFRSGSLAKPIRKLSEVTDRMAQGTLKVYIPEESNIQEISVLSQGIKQLQTRLLFQITSINEISNQIGASINRISTAIMELASSATETTSSITQISATVEETRETSAIATSKSQSVAMNSESTLEMADEGQIATTNAVEGMETIRDEMNSMANRINQLSEQTQSIGSIINTVEDIAEQSNLLAVNAAIEAAKAGEAGAGFAVVAQEVKNLSEQSKAATVRVRTILEEIRKATSATVLAAERSGKAVEAGAVRTAQVGDTISHLARAISESANTATQISISSQEQLTGMNQLVLAIEAIQNASSQNVDSTHQIDKSIKLLSELSQNLEELVSEFDL